MNANERECFGAEGALASAAASLRLALGNSQVAGAFTEGGVNTVLRPLMTNKFI